MVTVGETASIPERRFAVEAVAGGLGVAGDVAQVADELPAAFFPQFGYTLPEGAAASPVQFREPDETAMPAQQFEEPVLADGVGRGAGCRDESIGPSGLIHARGG